MNFRLTIILAVVLLVIGGVVYLGQRGGDSAGGGEDRAFVYRLDAERIVRLSVEHQGTLFAFDYVVDKWVFDDAEQTPVSTDRFGGLKYLLAGPRADRVLEGELDNAADYGLSSPQSTVIITDNTDRSIVLHFGDLNADQTDQFVSLEGSNNVFMISESWTSVLTNLVETPPYNPTPEALPEDVIGELGDETTPEATLTPTATP